MGPEAPIELARFFKHSKRFHYKKGEDILRAGNNSNDIFFLTKGYVKSYAMSQEGEELTLVIFQAGDFFPLQSGIVEHQNMHTYVAMTSVELYKASIDEFKSYLVSHPELMLHTLQRLVVRFGGLLDRMEHLVFGNAYSRIASLFVILTERFGQKQGSVVVIPFPLTHKDIASLVGMTRETVSLEVKKFEKKKILGKRRGLFVVHKVIQLQNDSMVDTFL